MRQWDADNIFVCLRALFELAVIHIPILSERIGANYPEITTGRKILMRHPSGYDDHISGDYGLNDALLTAQLNFGFSLINTKNLVSCAVIVVVGINSISPGAAPLVGMQKVFNRRGGIDLVFQIQSTLINQ